MASHKKLSQTPRHMSTIRISDTTERGGRPSFCAKEVVDGKCSRASNYSQSLRQPHSGPHISLKQLYFKRNSLQLHHEHYA